MLQDVKEAEKNIQDDRRYHRTKMQKEMIIQRLKEQGGRMTKQRRILLDIIFEEECSCCKEILYKASKQDPKIGSATVYRMINTLEEIGAISRKNMYKITCSEECKMEEVCTIELEDHTRIELSAKEWKQIIQEGLNVCGYLSGQRIHSVVAKTCE